MVLELVIAGLMLSNLVTLLIAGGLGYRAHVLAAQLVAEALSPREDGGDAVIAVFEAPTPGALRLLIDRSGLVTSVGAALWLGAEIERVFHGR